MSETFSVPNFDRLNLKEVTLLDADAFAGQNQVTILNEVTYSAGHIVLVGNIAQETSEVATIQSIASKVITLAANLKNKHLRHETLTRLRGDRIRLYRATNVDGSIPADSAFTYQSLFAVIEGDDATSDITDPAGGSGYWYKTTYYNSVTEEETSLAMSVAVRGGNYGKLVSIDSIRDEAGLNDNRSIDDGKIAERRDQAESEVLGKLAAAGYTMPLQTSNGDLYVPPVIENIARLMGAGYVLMKDYGAVSNGDTKDGGDKLDRANKLIKEIQNQENILQDITGAQLARTSQVSGWPDDTTATVGTDGGAGEPYQITMNKRF